MSSSLPPPEWRPRSTPFWSRGWFWAAVAVVAVIAVGVARSDTPNPFPITPLPTQSAEETSTTAVAPNFEGRSGGAYPYCTPGYSPCLPPAPDYDCAGTGDGPKYTGTVRVTGLDPYVLDDDNDGYGCE